MFDQFKAMGAMAGLMKDKERLRDAAARVRDRLDQTRVEGRAGGGAVRVEVSGAGVVLAVHVEPALAVGFGDGASRAAAEALIAEAVNDGLKRSRDAARAVVEAEAESMGLGELLPQIRGLMP